jgi:hypothetical protein
MRGEGRCGVRLDVYQGQKQDLVLVEEARRPKPGICVSSTMTGRRQGRDGDVVGAISAPPCCRPVRVPAGIALCGVGHQHVAQGDGERGHADADQAGDERLIVIVGPFEGVGDQAEGERKLTRGSVAGRGRGAVGTETSPDLRLKPRRDVLRRRTEGVGRLRTGVRPAGSFPLAGVVWLPPSRRRKASVRSKSRRKNRDADGRGYR